MKVYTLYHWRDRNDDNTSKLCGIFSSKEHAENAIKTLTLQRGFRDYPDCFLIDEHTVDEIGWAEGFGVDMDKYE